MKGWHKELGVWRKVGRLGRLRCLLFHRGSWLTFAPGPKSGSETYCPKCGDSWAGARFP